MENILYYGDNLPILRKYIPDNSIDLIYLDPPFNSQATYNILFKESNGLPSRAQITAFEDTWHWTEETEATFQEIVEKTHSNIVEMMRAFRSFIGNNDMMAYLTMMCIRLIELKRVLKDNGSIYLHCDPTASHYLKILMDSIFGKNNFQNEIVWCYSIGGKSKKTFARKHDTILFYSKNNEYYFDGKSCSIPRKPHTHMKIGIDSNGRTYQEKTDKKTGKVYKYYIDEGKIPEDWWPIEQLNREDAERLGYPTQKPEALLERIINASSKEGGIVLDPFCGCGTTVAVAHRLKRGWIGIDITHLAINLIKWRMKGRFGLQAGKDYKVIGEPEDLAGARQMAKENRYQFQWWALSLINARPYGDEKRGADTGIDGYLYFIDERDKVKRAIIQVKSGATGVKDVRDLGHVIERERAEMGIFITLEEPTRPMRTEASTKGFYKSPLGEKFPKIQILTINELLEDKRPRVPTTIVPHKVAKRHMEKPKQIKLISDQNEEE